MVLVNAQSISKSFSLKVLFKEISFSINENARIGLIGPNGAGKSTLLKIISGTETPDSGNLAVQRNLKIAYVHQIPKFSDGLNVLECIQNDLAKFHESDWAAEAAAETWIAKSELLNEQIRNDSLVNSLSGGGQKKVAIVRELAKEPDLLILDEPTNHLDFETIDWLKSLIRQFRGSVLIVTHDRDFLESIATEVWELDRRHAEGILKIKGNYSQFLESRSQLIAAQEAREVILKNTYRRELEWLRRGAKARTTKQKARIERAGDLVDELSELKSRNLVRKVDMNFTQDSAASKKFLEAKEISFSIGEKELFKKISCSLGPGRRLGLVGPNGCGKSTLIKVLIGELQPEEGTIKRAESLKPIFFEQNRESLDPSISVLKTLCPIGDWVEFQGKKMHIRGYLDQFLFDQGQADVLVGKLSGGEQARVLLAQLMLQPANLLILDEPTNDLDMQTLSILEDCLIQFQGAVILVSHDRFFMDQVCNEFLVFQKHWHTTQSHAYYASLEQLDEAMSEMKKLTSKNTMKKAEIEADNKLTSLPSQKRKLSYKEQREFDQMEDKILGLESELQNFQTEIIKPEVSTNAVKLTELTQKIHELQLTIDSLYKRWAELS